MNGRFVSYLRVSTDKQGRSGLGIEAVVLPSELHSDVRNFNGLSLAIALRLGLYDCTVRRICPLRLHCEPLKASSARTAPRTRLNVGGGGQDCSSAAEISLFNQELAVNHGTIHGPVISHSYHVCPPQNPT